MTRQERKSLISKTRTGYLYQDKYALLLLLDLLLQQKRIVEFYIDFPREDNARKSIDIRIIIESSEKEEIIYEVKTGDKFKEDKCEELGQELRDFYDYYLNHPCKCNLVIVPSPEIQSPFLTNWRDIQVIREYSKEDYVVEPCTNRTLRQTQDDCHKKFGFSKAEISKEDFIKFIKTLQIEPGQSLGNTISNQGPSDIDSCIESRIASINNLLPDNLKIRTGEWSYNNRTVCSNILQIIVESAGSGISIVPRVKEELCNTFSRRSYFDNHLPFSGNELVDTERKYKDAIAELFEIPRQTQLISPTQSTELKEISN